MIPGKYPKLDEFDMMILRFCSLGAGSCTRLAYSLGIEKPSVTERVKKLQEMGLINILDKKKQWEYRFYEITPQGEALVRGSDLFMDIHFLTLRSQGLLDAQPGLTVG